MGILVTDTMSANLTTNSSHGGHGVYGGHGGICKFLISPWSRTEGSMYLRVLRVRSFIVMLAHMVTNIVL